MSLATVKHSDVYETEIDLSSIVIGQSTSVGGLVVVSAQGPTDLRPYTSYAAFTAAFGNPDPNVSMSGYCAKDHFKEATTLYAARAVHADALWAGLALLRGSNGLIKLAPIPAGISNLQFPAWNTFATGSDQVVGLFVPNMGPGSFADSLAVSITTKDVSIPTGLAAQTLATGGTLAAATYEYMISAVGAAGETLTSTPLNVVIAGAGSTNANVLTWNLMPNAYAYNIYGRVVGSTFGLLVQIGQGTNTFTDTGALIPELAQQPQTTGPTPSTIFTVNFFDTSISTSTPQESWNVSFDDEQDGAGTTTEITHRINSFSQLLQYQNNIQNVLGAVLPQAVALTNLSGGDSGSAVTSYDIANAWSLMANRNIVPVNQLINGGASDPITQLAMDQLAQNRGEVVALLDVPSDQQTAQQAVNYRNVTLNLNSSYSALFGPDVLESDDILQKNLYVPFSGWASALCARTDNVANPAFSIAGLNRGLLDILGTRYEYIDSDMDMMSVAQVNYTRTLMGAGTALWSQRTLQSYASARSWLSVRRIANAIKIAMYNAGLYFLQEQNDEFTVRGMLKTFGAYLDSQVRARALYDYALVSDTRNNSVDDEIAGIRNVLVVLYPEIPIDSLYLDFAIAKQTVTVTEAVQSAGQA